MLNILYNNNQLIAFNKPAGIPVQADKTGDPTFQQHAEAYCKHPLQLVHILLLLYKKINLQVLAHNKKYYILPFCYKPCQHASIRYYKHVQCTSNH